MFVNKKALDFLLESQNLGKNKGKFSGFNSYGIATDLSP
jgi:hypothetical protein